MERTETTKETRRAWLRNAGLTAGAAMLATRQINAAENGVVPTMVNCNGPQYSGA